MAKVEKICYGKQTGLKWINAAKQDLGEAPCSVDPIEK
jgi:hypothetical protein